MKKKILIFILCIAFLACFIPLVLALARSYPATITYQHSNYAATSNGMYYITGNFLKYYDYAAKKAVALCSKPDCSHTSTDCNAYYNCQGSADLLIYDGYLFISYFNVEIVGFDNNTDDVLQDSAICLEQCQLDGSKRRVIYQADNGAVLSMMAKDGFLYYTTYTNGTSDRNWKQQNNHLFRYNLRFHHTKELASYSGNEDQSSASLQWVCGKNISTSPHLLYTYTDKKNHSLSQLSTLIEKDKISPLSDPLSIEEIWSARNLYQYEDTFYVMGSAASDTDSDVFTFGILLEDGTIQKLLTAANATGTAFEDYIEISMDDTSHLLYNLPDHTAYVSKYIATGEEVNVPDLLGLLEEDNICYFDSTDYTGIEIGHVFTSDPTTPSAMSFDEYLDQYFVRVEQGIPTGAFELCQ